MAILKDFKEVQFSESLSKLFHKLVALKVKVLWPEAVLQIGIWSESLCACNEHEYKSTQWTYHSGIVERGHSDICMSLPCPYTVVVALQVASSIGEAKELHGQIS